MAFAGNPHIVRKGNGVAQLVKLAEAAGQSYKAGELVYLVSGAVTVCASNATVVFGIAQKDATGTTGAEAYVEPIFPEDDVEMVCSTTVASTNIGINYADVVASNVHKLDLSDTSNDMAVLVSPVLDYGGALTTKAIVHFLPTVCQAVTGA